MAALSSSGAYLLSGHDGPYALERFTCSHDADGWRYDGTRTDPVTGAVVGSVELHLAGRTTRLHVEAGAWVLRGAAAHGEVLWRRGDQERTAPGDGFTGTSPAFLVACARLARERLHLIELTEPVLATRTATQQWSAAGRTEHDGIEVDSWQVDDLSTGERRELRLAGALVVQAPGVRLVELTGA